MPSALLTSPGGVGPTTTTVVASGRAVFDVGVVGGDVGGGERDVLCGGEARSDPSSVATGTSLTAVTVMVTVATLEVESDAVEVGRLVVVEADRAVEVERWGVVEGAVCVVDQPRRGGTDHHHRGGIGGAVLDVGVVGGDVGGGERDVLCGGEARSSVVGGDGNIVDRGDGDGRRWQTLEVADAESSTVVGRQLTEPLKSSGGV